MNIRALLFCTIGLGPPAVLFAQHAPSTGSGRVAAIEPPPAPVVAYPSAGRGTVFYGNIPVAVLGDGRVFADFGRGYEQVVRTCGLRDAYGGDHGYGSQLTSTNTSPLQPVVVQPTVIQPTIGAAPAPLPYTPPVPAQQTASQEMTAQVTHPGRAIQPTTINAQSCWAVGAGGRIFVGWP
jgi:hypothetical protein